MTHWKTGRHLLADEPVRLIQLNYSRTYRGRILIFSSCSMWRRNRYLSSMPSLSLARSGGMSLKPPGSILATIKPVLLSDIIVTADWTKFSMVLAVAVQGIPAAEAIPSRSTRPLVCVGGQPTTPSYRSLSSTIIVKLGGDSFPTLHTPTTLSR